MLHAHTNSDVLAVNVSIFSVSDYQDFVDIVTYLCLKKNSTELPLKEG